jgi:outer membrane protein W
MTGRTAIAVLVAFASGAPLMAQGYAGVDIGVWASGAGYVREVQPPSQGAWLDLADGTGFGVGAVFYLRDRLSAELSIFTISSDAVVKGASTSPVTPATLRLTPVMLTLQTHFTSPQVLRPYAGGGIAYVLAGDLHWNDTGDAEPHRLDVDDRLTVVLNGGLQVALTQGLGLGIDVRYLPFAARAGGEHDQVESRIDPLILSVGLRFRF